MLADPLLFVYDRNCGDRPRGLHMIVILLSYLNITAGLAPNSLYRYVKN